MSNAESIVMEEGPCDLQLLLRSEDRSPLKHICVLLHCITGNCRGAWSWGPKVGSSLYSFHYHPSQCCRNSKVPPLILFCIDFFRMCFWHGTINSKSNIFPHKNYSLVTESILHPILLRKLFLKKQSSPVSWPFLIYTYLFTYTLGRQNLLHLLLPIFLPIIVLV